MELIASHIVVTAKKTSLLRDVSLTLQPGEVVALLGPNGAGKTTLLRAALGFIKPDSGQVSLGGADVQTLSPIQRARRVAYLPQTRFLEWPNIVHDVVALGRYSHGANLAKLGAADLAAVDAAIAACDISHLSQRKADTLSGGELARVHCARAFAAQAPLLIADEPVSALDPRHQYRVMNLIRDYVHLDVARPRGALVVLHDINLAARNADRLIWMKDGRIVANGSPADTLTEERLADVYGVKARVIETDVIIDGVF
ncbi:ABC transporter ATP-binding protein [Litorimonas sp. RW-G-Af-16]|uniref:ABC transporter ATP-binding protein n=1 Tax=Litorimonas sp. RW-G-Af-16 TaxID=3241168 RepID=UPI00390C783F